MSSRSPILRILRVVLQQKVLRRLDLIWSCRIVIPGVLHLFRTCLSLLISEIKVVSYQDRQRADSADGLVAK